jgi:xanthine dehydrogenase accessory factor
VKRILEALLAQGCPQPWLQQIHAPIGLDIGAVTPAEIAISILAELVAARNGKAHPMSLGAQPVSAPPQP